MKILIVACLVGFAAFTAAETAKDVVEKPYYDLKDAEKLFAKFENDYHRIYRNEADRQLHFEMFKKNLAIVNQLNTDPKQGDAVFDINDFADNTPEEMKKHFGYLPRRVTLKA